MRTSDYYNGIGSRLLVYTVVGALAIGGAKIVYNKVKDIDIMTEARELFSDREDESSGLIETLQDLNIFNDGDEHGNGEVIE